MYSVTSTLQLDTVDSGVSVLVTGPPETGKPDLVLNVLSEGCVRTQHALLVTLGRDPASLYDELDDRVASLAPRQVGVVDATPADDGTDGLPPATYTREPSPGDLTGIGMGCSEFFETDATPTRLALFSVTDLLAAADLKTVFRFLHILTGRVSAADALGLFVMNDEAHDDQTRHTVRQLFDFHVETRRSAGERSFRVSGVDRSADGWQRF